MTLAVCAVIAIGLCLAIPAPAASKDVPSSCSTLPALPRPLSFEASHNAHLGGDSPDSHALTSENTPTAYLPIHQQDTAHGNHSRQAGIAEFSPLYRRPPPSLS